MTQVNELDILTTVQLGLQVLRLDLRTANLPQEGALPIQPVTEKTQQQKNEEEARRMPNLRQRARMALQHVAEETANQSRAETPQQCPSSVKCDEGGVGHLALASNRRRHRSKSGNKFGEQQGTRAITLEEISGATHAGCRLKGELAHHAHDAAAVARAHEVPDGVADDAGPDG